MSFPCPACGEALAIETPEPVDTDAVSTPEAFMRLGYRISSQAVWACPEHGAIDRVTVAIIGDHIDFVTPSSVPSGEA